MEIKDITPGESWACEFTVTTWLDSRGQPQPAPQLQPGEATQLEPGEYTSVGIITVRDLSSGLVRLQDTKSACEFTVRTDQISRIDRVEWQ